jgi:hypothetical protein
MFIVEHTTDFEFYSSTSNGAVQGYGYVFHAGWYILLRHIRAPLISLL